MDDVPSLKSKLANVGFKQINEKTYKEGDCKDVEILDTRPFDALFIDAIK